MARGGGTKCDRSRLHISPLHWQSADIFINISARIYIEGDATSVDRWRWRTSQLSRVKERNEGWERGKAQTWLRRWTLRSRVQPAAGHSQSVTNLTRRVHLPLQSNPSIRSPLSSFPVYLARDSFPIELHRSRQSISRSTVSPVKRCWLHLHGQREKKFTLVDSSPHRYSPRFPHFELFLSWARPEAEG